MDLRNAELHLARIVYWKWMKRFSQHSPNISFMPSIILKDLQILCHLILKNPTGLVLSHFVIEKNEAEKGYVICANHS